MQFHNFITLIVVCPLATYEQFNIQESIHRVTDEQKNKNERQRGRNKRTTAKWNDDDDDDDVIHYDVKQKKGLRSLGIELGKRKRE